MHALTFQEEELHKLKVSQISTSERIYYVTSLVAHDSIETNTFQDKNKLKVEMH